MADSNQRPKLRALDIKRVQQGGREYLHLRDPMSLSGEELLVPVHLIPLLALSDGQRDLGSIRAAAMLLHGVSVSQEQVDAFFGRLDEALLLEGPRFEEARARVLERYRGSEYRTPALAGPSYPEDPVALEEVLDGYMEAEGAGPRRLYFDRLSTSGPEGMDSGSGAGVTEGRAGVMELSLIHI